MPRKTLKKTTKPIYNLPDNNFLGKIESDIKSNQSKLSMVLGGLIILVVGILIFNYFNKNKPSLGPAQQTEQEQQQDVAPDKLPGKYTVKDGDTLFLIAEKYYKDGDKFDLIAKANNLADVNVIEKGQIIEIPTSPSTSPLPVEETATGGGNTTIWGPKIEGDTYTVAEDDWLSKIAGRAYGDIYAYKRLVETNNIKNPDYIVPGMVLKIPR